MTPAEKSAIEEARGILHLHLDSFILTTRTADEDGTDRVNSDWCGSLPDVIGMNRITALRLDKIAIDNGGEPEMKERPGAWAAGPEKVRTALVADCHHIIPSLNCKPPCNGRSRFLKSVKTGRYYDCSFLSAILRQWAKNSNEPKGLLEKMLGSSGLLSRALRVEPQINPHFFPKDFWDRAVRQRQ
jgi:hypothetical protein